MIHNVAVVFKVQQEENYIYICGTVEKTSVISDEKTTKGFQSASFFNVKKIKNISTCN